MPLIRLVTHFPRRALLLVLLATLAFAALIPGLHIDTDPENMLPDDQPARLFHNQVKQRFSLHDTLVVGAVNEAEGIFNPRSLAALNRLTTEILALEGVVERDLMALATVDNIHQSAPATLAFEWMMKQAPTDPDEALRLREAVQRLPLLHNTLVSADGQAAAIYVPLENKDQSYRIAEQIRALLPTLDSDDEYHITGLPVAEDQFGSEMFMQMAITAPLAGLVIFALLWLLFRNAVLVVAPMLVAMATVLITMGALVGLGFSVHIMSSMIAIFLMPIAVVDSVHLLSEFADRYRPGRPLKEVIGELFRTLFRPMLFTTLSSAAGFLSLLLTPIPPVQIFGAFIGFGILLAFVLTLVIVPAYIMLMSPTRLAALQGRHHGDDPTAVARGARILGGLSRRRPRLLLSLFMVMTGFGVAGLSQLQVNDNPVRWFKSDHEIPVADRTLNRHFAGTYNAYLVLDSLETPDHARTLGQRLDRVAAEAIEAGVTPGYRPPAPREGELTAYLGRQLREVDERLFAADASQIPYLENLLEVLEQTRLERQRFLDPRLLDYLDGLQRHLDAQGLVGKSHSLSDLVMTLNRELVSGEPADYRLPGSVPAVSQLLMQYQSSHRPQDLWHLVTPDYRDALVWLQLPSGDNQAVQRVVNAVEAYRQAHPLPAGLQLNWAGKAYLNLEWQQAMVNGMLNSLLSAFVVVALMMLLLFRSPGFALLAMLPLTLTITLIYGLIGWVGKDYDMPIAVLSALTLGLSVDFAIHFVERLRALMAEHGDIERALDALFDEPARAIARNALVIALGFTPLLLAPLVPYITVGLFMAGIMAVSALVTLLLLPILVRRLAPRLFPLPSSPAGALP